MKNKNNNISDKTSIPLTKKTRDRLRDMRIYKRETYDEIIIRLIDKYETN